MGDINSKNQYLRREEINCICSSWPILKEKINCCAITLCLKFFGEYPEVRKYFDHILSNATKDEVLVNHCIKLITYVDRFIQNLYEFNTFHTQILHHALIHKNKNIPLKIFLKIVPAFINMISIELGADYTPEIAAAWRKMLTYVLTTSVQTQDKFSEEELLMKISEQE